MGKLPVLIQQIYRKIQISGKGDPEQIGEHKPARRFVYTEESEHCQENKYPENDYPYKGKQIRFKLEKENRPEKVKCKLHRVKYQRAALRLIGDKHKIGRNAHQHIQYRPRHGERPFRRRKGRPVENFENLHAVLDQKRGQPTHRKRQGYAGQQLLPLNFQTITS